ncbi:MAG TPA: hypothetical protein VF649_05095 [Sphingomonas sp.]|jgi:hypothetical protein|uniref:hypothetical protein n=1 Tax=Sphingomonas sp. TaxID=28214 RepID=UPI002ED7AF7D
MTAQDAVLRSGVDRCRRIVAGVEELHPFLANVLPVQDDDLARLPVVQRIASIALLKRFEQLQDMLGRLVRTLLSWTGEDVRELTRRDVANWMERLRLVETSDDWLDLTGLRNRLVHEYPINEIEQVDRVNECWVAMPRLVTIFDAVQAYLAKQGFIA